MDSRKKADGTKKAASGISILEGAIGKNLIKFASPIAASSILQQLFNSADTAVVGHFTDTTALAAVGTNAEIVGFLVTMSSGTAVGLNVLLSWKIGEKRSPEQIRRTMHTGFLMAFLIGILLMAAGFFLAAPVLHLMHAPKAAYSQAVLYLRIYSLGLPLLMVYDFVCAAERARGNSLRPLWALICSGILNVLLNLTFVIVFRLGVAGVAIATDLSNGASVFLTLRWLSRDSDPGFRFRFSELCLDRGIVKTVLRIGVPAALQGAVFCIANLF
ncbi:MAG: MATE family efflux transporter, partial [Eubacteriales bacterium]|nr:MATE family efflux transporter [Eubacteriales bacterium]